LDQADRVSAVITNVGYLPARAVKSRSQMPAAVEQTKQRSGDA
jgi:hypothetical protein